MEYIAFMAAIFHSEADYVEDVLKEYKIGAYLIALETTTTAHLETNGEHFHFLVQMDDRDYSAFSKRLFIVKYKLRGKAIKDKPRQYGKVKKIEDFNRMGAYTVKDGNIRTNMTHEQLHAFQVISFKEKEKLEFRDQVMDYVNSKVKIIEGKYDFIAPTHCQIGVAIIDFYRDQKIKTILTKSTLDNYIRHYMMHFIPVVYLPSINIYKKMFPFEET